MASLPVSEATLRRLEAFRPPGGSWDQAVNAAMDRAQQNLGALPASQFPKLQQGGLRRIPGVAPPRPEARATVPRITEMPPRIEF